MKDSYGRTINYMRISITDRCNLRCRYCMPEGTRWLPMEEILTCEEITGICREAVGLGITRFKITGGEPLMRKGCADLVRLIKDIPGTEQVTMTTNGVLLERQLDPLLAAGLNGVNISLDTLDRKRYQRITGFDELPRVLRSIEAAAGTGIPVKINAVLQKGINDGEWQRLAELAGEYPLDVRFIELMPIGYGAAGAGVDNRELLEWMRERYGRGVEPDERVHGNGPAVYYKIPGFRGSIGLISAIHGKFCGSCNRLRLTSTGELKPCLCFGESVSVRDAVRCGGPEDIRRCLLEAVEKKPGMHEFEDADGITEKRKMSQIGG